MKYKEIAIKNHYLSFGYNFKAFRIGINISKYSVDLDLYPFFIGFEFLGKYYDETFTKRIQQILAKQKH